MPHVDEARSSRPRYATAAAALVALQGVGLIAAGVYLIVRALGARRRPTGRPPKCSARCRSSVGLVIVAIARQVLGAPAAGALAAARAGDHLRADRDHDGAGRTLVRRRPAGRRRGRRHRADGPGRAARTGGRVIALTRRRAGPPATA